MMTGRFVRAVRRLGRRGHITAESASDAFAGWIIIGELNIKVCVNN
jgi:hypothetical protein